MRDASIAVLREIGVDTGGSNVQFAVNPDDGRMVVIEMNPRVSRSSALASKATGFPIAKVAAKLAVGYTLDELKNDITGGATPASFEPTHRLRRHQGPALRVREVPAGRRPPDDADEVGRRGDGDRPHLPGVLPEGAARPRGRRRRPRTRRPPTARRSRRSSATPGPERIWYVADAFAYGCHARRGLSSSRTSTRGSSRRSRRSSTSRWSSTTSALADIDADALRELKRKGFSDRAARVPARQRASTRCARARHALGIRPVYKRVDTCAAEFATRTAYMYSTYEEECEAQPTDRKKIMVLGGGPEPHRAGHRVRLLLRARGARAARGRLRDHHGQLQPGDGLDRLRHLRPALLRAADARGRARDRRQGEARTA